MLTRLESIMQRIQTIGFLVAGLCFSGCRLFDINISEISGLHAQSCATVRVGTATDTHEGFDRGDLKLFENRRYLMYADGSPFFYLGDTAWELFHRLDREEAELYLENRREKKFTVIQAVALAELDGLETPNAYGDRPLIDNDPARPAVTTGANPANEKEYDYWDHVDWIVRKAADKGLYIGFLPIWGDKVVKKWGIGPVVFNEQNAFAYGKWLGNRYKNDPNIIWILGGDRPAEDNGVDYKPVFRAMARGIRSSDSRHLMTFHPMGGHSSSEWFHKDGWLDFNMLQSGHGTLNNPNYKAIAADYALVPVKPCMDGEPRYEDHPVNWKPENGWFDDFDVRQAAYWGVFSGGHGITYGCHNIWQMYDRGREPISSARHTWHETLDLPAAWDMQYLRKLVLSRPFFDRIPDPSLIVSENPGGMAYAAATRGKDYAFLYIPTGKKVTVKMGVITGDKVVAWWFDPRQGSGYLIGEFVNSGEKEFSPPGGPGRGNDWVLVLDDAAGGYRTPESRIDEQ